MSLVGKSLKHYEISAEIGKGGMGEVYQAKDQKLGRDVAIKVLPEEFAEDSDRVARFQREAKLLASLNHPNIAAIHGLEEVDGTNFLVMELVKGETLADRISHGSIPVDEALKLALQIAEALEAAHEKGVIHRDLKPANIKVTPDGKVKVLDFGLAKAFAGEQADLNLSNSPTLSEAATMQGVILGTAAYMSPEQARGKSVDKRADIWAFGVVLFEMLTGRSLFSGEDVSSTLARVLEREPDFLTLPRNLHPRIRLLLDRCLKKEVRNRYGSIGDARVDLQEVLAGSGDIYFEPAEGSGSRPGMRFNAALAAVIALAVCITAVVVWVLKPSPPETRSVERYKYQLPDTQNFNISNSLGHTLAISSDGSKFVYRTDEGLYLRDQDELAAHLIPGTGDNPQSPFFSPDGLWVGYWSQVDSKLKRISIRGGSPVDICDATIVFGASWSRDNTIVYSELMAGIKRVPVSGNRSPESLIEGVALVAPQLLPDGDSLLLTDYGSDPHRIVVYSLSSKERKELFPGFAARYLPTGHLVYSLYPENDTLFAVAFDSHTHEVVGEDFPIVNDVGSIYDVSDSGKLVYIPHAKLLIESFAAQRSLVWVDREGNEELLDVDRKDYDFIKISPDGDRVALVITSSGNPDIHILDLTRENRMSKLTFGPMMDAGPVWTREGRKIAFLSNRDGQSAIYWKEADNTGNAEMLLSTPGYLLFPWAWSEDGRILVYRQLNLEPRNSVIAMMSLDGNRESKLLLQEGRNVYRPQISPDGKWMAYSSDRSDQLEIYVRPFPDVYSQGPWMISNGGGHSVLWSPDGRELFYRNGNEILAVPVETSPGFDHGNATVLFRGEFYSGIGSILGLQIAPWDIHPESKRFLMVKQAEMRSEVGSEHSTEAEPRQINIILNFDELLKQKAVED